MKKIKTIASVLALLLVTAFTSYELVTWNVKENYQVTFHGGKMSGGFKGLKAVLAFNEADLGHSKIWASVDAVSIETGSGLKNKHAISALDAKQFPLIQFESGSISKTANGYEATGKLTLKGVAKDMVLPFTFETVGGESVFKGKFTVITKDFNVTKSGTPEQVEVELNIPVTK